MELRDLLTLSLLDERRIHLMFSNFKTQAHLEGILLTAMGGKTITMPPFSPAGSQRNFPS